METKTKMGRPPAPWMFNFVDLKLEEKWTDPYEVAERLKIQVWNVKSFFKKISVSPKYEMIDGAVKARFKVSDLKKSAKDYIKPWQ